MFLRTIGHEEYLNKNYDLQIALIIILKSHYALISK